MDQKSIKIEFSSLSVSASIFTSIFHRFFFPTPTHWISKKYVFPYEKQGFLKKTPFEDNIDFGSILEPTWLHVGFQNRRFSEIMAFQEAFKNSSFFASIFYRFWVRLGLQHGTILEAKTAPNSKKWVQKVGMVASQERSYYDLPSEHRLRSFWHRFLGGQGSIF